MPASDVLTIKPLIEFYPTRTRSRTAVSARMEDKDRNFKGQVVCSNAIIQVYEHEYAGRWRRTWRVVKLYFLGSAELPPPPVPFISQDSLTAERCPVIARRAPLPTHVYQRAAGALSATASTPPWQWLSAFAGPGCERL